MTQVKRGTGRAAVSRKQQRYSLMKLVGVLVLISGFVALLLRNDPFPGVRKAAMRHRRQNELDKEQDIHRDFREPVGNEEKSIQEKEVTPNNENGDSAGEISDNEGKDEGRIYTFELANLKDGKKGNVVIQTKPEWAPLGVEHFHKLMDDDFYKNAKFFRVVNDFVVQFGIPAIPSNVRMTPIKDDPVVHTNARGTLTYATSGPNTRTAQLFINTRKGGNKFLDNQGFSPFGEVIAGMEFVDEIYAGYGERPNQGMIQSKGNEYLDKEFPLLSLVSSAYQGTPHEDAEGQT